MSPAASEAERSLRDSEDKYRAIITSMDEGFLIGEVLFDAAGNAIDVLCLETNPAFYVQSGARGPVEGRLLKSVSTADPESWLPLYARVVKTRVAERFEQVTATGSQSRHYNIRIMPLGDPSLNRVAVLFQNITDRVRREANLAFLAEVQDDLSRLTFADEIMNAVGKKICSFLNVSYAYLVQVDEARDEARPRYIVNWKNVPPLPDVFPLSKFVKPEFIRLARAGEPLVVRDTGNDPRTDAAAYESRQMKAFVAVPFLKKGEWKYTLSICDSQARNWTPTEVDLIVELANRVFPRMERAIAEQTVAEDLRDTRLLRELGAKLVSEREMQALYDEILGAAITLTHADAGTVQILDPATQTLAIASTRGFSSAMTDYFANVDAGSETSCGLALASNARTFVDFDHPGYEDIESMRLHVDSGYRSAQSTPLLTRSGTPLGMVSTHWRQTGRRPSERELRFLDLLVRQVSDLLELRRSEASLRNQQDELKEADRRKDEFIAMLAHELRNPLAPVRTGLEILRVAGDSREGVERVRSMMERQVKHMVRLIDDLLEVSRITSGRIRLQRQSTSVFSLIHMAVEANREALAKNDIGLGVDVPDPSATVDVDPTRFVQVVSNLLQNAVKFTDAGGRVDVAATFVDSPSENGRQLVVTVTDSGIGISNEALPHVFDLFGQDGSNSVRAQGGLGIGLALSRRLMELHGGSIEASSSGLGSGSSFTLRLPTAAEAAPIAATPDSGADERTNRRAVVIDDNKDAADATAMLVSVMGGDVRVAYDGETGIKEVLAFRPDVVFLDIGMPGIDGYETCRRIRKEVGAAPMIVALTGWGQAQDQLETKRAGFDIHLTKPADPRVLERLLADAKIAS